MVRKPACSQFRTRLDVCTQSCICTTVRSLCPEYLIDTAISFPTVFLAMDVNSATDQVNQDGQEEEPASTTSGRPCGSTTSDGTVAPYHPVLPPRPPLEEVAASYTLPSVFRHDVRHGLFDGPTNNICPGYLQCNLVVLPTSLAFDFLLFCQRNPQACPLLEVCCDDDEPEEEIIPGRAVSSEDPDETTTTTSTATTAASSSRTRSYQSRTLASGVDLRTDLPKYVRTF
jgi:hypothetical protein